MEPFGRLCKQEVVGSSPIVSTRKEGPAWPGFVSFRGPWIRSLSGAARAIRARREFIEWRSDVAATVECLWAFSDESERAGVMLLAVVLLEPGEVDGARRSMRQPLLPGQRRVHTAKELPRRRRIVIDAVGRLDGLSATVLHYRRPPGTTRVAGRHLLLQAATGLVVGSGVTSWVLDGWGRQSRCPTALAASHHLRREDSRGRRPHRGHRPPAPGCQLDASRRVIG